MATKYDPKMLPTILEMGKAGASQKMIWSVLGISSSTASHWKKKFPDFAETLDLALVHSQAHWERTMLANAENKNFNTRMVEIAVRGQFPLDYKEQREQKVEVKADVNIDFGAAVTDLIKQLKDTKD
jgi:hypothetical protein